LGPIELNLAAVAGAIFVVGTGSLMHRAHHRRALANPLIVDAAPVDFQQADAQKRPSAKEQA
jgi:hypothetical protein